MSAEINRDNHGTSGSEAQVYNVLSSSSQGPRQATTRPSSTDCVIVSNILPGIADEENRVIFQNSQSVEASSVLPPHYQDIEQKCGDVTGGSKQTLPTLYMPEPAQKSSEQRVVLLQLQVEKLQRVLQKQARLLSLLSPGLMLAPVVSAQWLSPTPALVADHPDDRNGSPSTTLPEPRDLPPIQEESVEEPHPVSPFGMRKTLSANPEDRPIRPAVGEMRKTFEDFLEVQLKMDENSLSETKQNIKDAQKMHGKKFLKKGDGVSCIGKSKARISNLLSHTKQVTAGFPKQPQQVAPPSQFSRQRLITRNTPPVAQKPSGAIVGLWQGTDAHNLGQISVEKRAASWENGKISVTATAAHLYPTAESGDCPVSQSQMSHAVENKKRCPQDHTQDNNSRRNSLHQTSSSDREATLWVSPQSIGAVSFKKVNDQIVHVSQRATFSADSESDRGQSSIKPDGPKMLSLATELMQSLHISSSSESSEDDSEWRCHRSLVSPTSTALCPRDQNVDLSDGDYASDAPSETGPCSTVQTHTSNINSLQLSSSSENSDTELTSFSWNIADTGKKPAEIKLTSASQLLSSIFPKIEPADKRALHDKQREKFLSSKDNRRGDQAPGQTRRDLTQAIKADMKHETLLADLKNKQDKAMQFLRDNTRNDEKSTRCKMDRNVAQLQQQMVAIWEQLEQRGREWSWAHGLLESRMDSLIRENQELRGRLTCTAPATQMPPPPRSPFWNSNQNIQRTKDQRPSTPFRMSSESLDATRSLVRCHRSNANSGRKVSWVSEDNPNKWSDQPPRGRQTPPAVSQTTSSDFHHMGNSNPSAAQDRRNEVREEIHHPDGKVEQILSSGCRVVIYRNGTKKEVSADEKSVTITFFNGDVKQILADGKVIYYYHDSQATHTTFPSGLEVLNFANKQTEEHHPDGNRKIIFPDGTIKHIFSDGREESTFPDGTVVKFNENGEKSVDFINGQREIHTSVYKKREYPDGTVKTVYTNGRQETTYSSGKVCIRNNDITGIKK